MGKSTEEIFGSRIELTYNGENILGATMLGTPRPQNEKDLIVILEALLETLKAKTVPDVEVLGKFSPKDEQNEQKA